MAQDETERPEDTVRRLAHKLVEYHDSLKSVVETQGWHGNWNYSPYMRGLFNGLELALALFEDREPSFRDGPKLPDMYICDLDEDFVGAGKSEQDLLGQEKKKEGHEASLLEGTTKLHEWKRDNPPDVSPRDGGDSW